MNYTRRIKPGCDEYDRLAAPPRPGQALAAYLPCATATVFTGGGRRITPGILPFALRAAAFSRVPIRSRRIGRTSRFSSSSRLRSTSSASAIPEPELPFVLVEGGGFEPPKAKPADLQSAPVDRLGIPPRHKPRIVPHKPRHVNRRAGARTGPPTGPWAGNWSWRQESNPRPADYKSAALPTELRQPDRNAADAAAWRNPATPGRPCLPSRGGPKRSRSGLREP